LTVKVWWILPPTVTYWRHSKTLQEINNIFKLILHSTKAVRTRDYRRKNTYKNRNVGSVAESNVENGTVLREVDLLTAEHGGGGLGYTTKHINGTPYQCDP
jgi:hypothetical protein